MMAAGKITALEVQKRNKQRISVFVDDVYAFSLSIDDAARLYKGQTLTEAEIDALRDHDEVGRAVDVGARFLAVRPRSVDEVRRKLAEKDVPSPVIDLAIERLTDIGYLDDVAFAAFWVRERLSSKPISPRALRYELRQKGVASDIIDEVLVDLDAAEAAYDAAQAGVRRLRGSTLREFREKLIGALARRGFGYSDAKVAVQRVIDELPEDFFAGDLPDPNDLPNDR